MKLCPTSGLIYLTVRKIPNQKLSGFELDLALSFPGFRRLPRRPVAETGLERVGHPLHVFDLQGRVYPGRVEPWSRENDQKRSHQVDQGARPKPSDLHRFISCSDSAASTQTKVIKPELNVRKLKKQG